MSQDFITAIQTIATILGSIVGISTIWKVVTEQSHVKRDRLREEYKFAKKFLGEINASERHPYLSQLGYQAIVGNVSVSSEALEFLLSLKGSRDTIRHYLLGRSYLQFYSTSHPFRISYKNSYEKTGMRKFLKAFYVGAYIVTYCLGVAPLFLIQYKLLSVPTGTFLFFLCVIAFFPLAFLSLKENVKIISAEKLMKWQASSAKSNSSEPFKPVVISKS